MKYAITPYGAGRRVGYRPINDTDQLRAEETFTLPNGTTFDGKVLAENGTSLRNGTPQELDPTPTVDQIYDDSIRNQRVLKALILALNDGSLLPAANKSTAEIKAILKAKM